jgi:7,8-dihydropterin-6-yl-methyl-4-(beta-D-ribofuranosyl)aminobenzene 5'-phosphate synthase
MRVTILVDNKASGELVPEHGFSAWIEAAGRRILFDTGQGPALAENVERLSIDVRRADELVLSHGHYDHTGGVPWVLARAPDVHVYCHPATVGDRFAVRNGAPKPIGMAAATRAALGSIHPDRMHWTELPLEIAPGVGVTGVISRLTDYEDTGGPFFFDAAGKHPDPIDDDLALWMRTEKGLVVVVGCSHAGLVNTLKTAVRLSGTSRIHAVIGGLHLLEASWTRIARTARALRAFSPDTIVPCHCTGERALDSLRNAFGARVAPGMAGSTYTFSSNEATHG